jgi:hypothetical protein
MHYPEAGGSKFNRNAAVSIPIYTASFHRRPAFSVNTGHLCFKCKIMVKSCRLKWCRISAWILRGSYHCLKYSMPIITDTMNFFIILSWRYSSWWSRASSLSRLHNHTQIHHKHYDSSGGVISSTQRTQPDNTQYSQEKDINAPEGIQTRNPSKLAAADPRLRPRSYWDRLIVK